MKRKTFIKSGSAALAGSFLFPWMSACKPQSMTTSNWAGNYTYKAKRLLAPASMDELIEQVRKARATKALGTRHCFNDIADSPESQISTANLNRIRGIDESGQTVTVEAGIKYGQLSPYLEERGFALHNLASLPHISVGGACATATHGSGVKNGNLPSAVRSMELINASGEVIPLSPDTHPAVFNGTVVGLGGLGIVSALTLSVQKTFRMQQRVYQYLPLQSLKENFETILSAGYSVSLFTDWLNQVVSQVWVKSVYNPADTGTADFYGARAAVKNLHPIEALDAVNCTAQMGEPGTWYDRMPHFKMGFTPSSGEELQAEYFVPLENGLEAMLALEKKKELIYPLLQISEIRTIDADPFWISPCHNKPCLSIHFTLKPNWPEVQKLLPVIEAELAPFGAKPHWGKLFTLDAATLQSRYEKMGDFVNLLRSFDPEGKFRNHFLDTFIYSFEHK